VTEKVLWRFFTVKTLIRVAFAVISLGGIAQAQTSGKSPPPQSGNNYNFTNGGTG
jgi:hypothetical protein